MYVYVIVVNTASLAGQRHRLSVSRMAHSWYCLGQSERIAVGAAAIAAAGDMKEKGTIAVALDM